MTEALMIKRLGSLAPTGDAAMEALKRIPDGAALVVDWRDQRRASTQRHKYIFALLNIMFENQEAFENFEQYRKYILIRLGHCDVFNSPDGPVPIAHSMQWAKMPEDERSRLVDEILTFAVNVLDFNRGDLESETRDRAA